MGVLLPPYALSTESDYTHNLPRVFDLRSSCKIGILVQGEHPQISRE